MMPTAALALIHNPDDPTFVLVVWSPKRRTWGLPGGKVEEGETPFQACVREVYEEVGIDICIAPSPAPVFAHGGDTGQRLIAVLSVASWQGKPRKMENGSPIAWMTIDHLIDEDAHPYAGFYTEVFSKLVFDR